MIQQKREQFFFHKFKETSPYFGWVLNRPFWSQSLCSDLQ